jgi:hypothetical protein
MGRRVAKEARGTEARTAAADLPSSPVQTTAPNIAAEGCKCPPDASSPPSSASASAAYQEKGARARSRGSQMETADLSLERRREMAAWIVAWIETYEAIIPKDVVFFLQRPADSLVLEGRA